MSEPKVCGSCLGSGSSATCYCDSLNTQPQQDPMTEEDAFAIAGKAISSQMVVAIPNPLEFEWTKIVAREFMRRYNAQLQASAAELADLRQVAQGLREQVSNLVGQLSAAQCDAFKLASDNRQLVRDAESRVAWSVTLQEQITKLEAEAAQWKVISRCDCSDLQAKITKLESNLATCVEIAEMNDKDWHEIRDERDDLQARVKELEKELNERK